MYALDWEVRWRARNAAKQALPELANLAHWALSKLDPESRKRCKMFSKVTWNIEYHTYIHQG